MKVQGGVLAVAAVGLVACMPETEINADNLEVVLSVSSVTTQVNDTVQLGVESQASLSKSLTRLSAKALSNFYVEDKCLNEIGDYQFTGEYSELEPGFEGQFNLAFNQCQQVQSILDGVLKGQFNGQVSQRSLKLDYTLTGGIDLTTADQRVRVTDYDANVAIDADYSGLSMLSWAVRYQYAGLFQYNTQAFKGRIRAETITEVHWRYSGHTLTEVTGEVHYTDEQGNRLSVVHSENGVSVTLNEQWVRTYSHEEWTKKF